MYGSKVKALEMENPSTAMYGSIDKKYTKSYENITVSDNIGYRHISRIHPKTVSVNE